MKTSLKQLRPLFFLIAALLLVNVFAAIYFKRFDLTQNKRYSLSEASKKIIEDVKSPIIVDVFLQGDFPSEFKRLQNETRYLLEEYSAYNRQIKFNFINPLKQGEDANQVANKFHNAGMTPQTLNVSENGKTSESMIFPWAIASYNDQQTKIHLLKNKLGNSTQELVNNSVQQLEYAFSDAFNKIIHKKNKKVAIMRGNGELPDGNIADFAKAIKPYYFIAPFTLDSVENHPQKTLAELEKFDLIIEAKPTEAFTEKEKYVLDQYLMKGGKALWLIDHVVAEKDSLFNTPEHSMLAYPRDLKLTDFFFKYGIRINPSLINDVVSAPIILAQGSGNNTQFNPFPWFYEPLAVSEKKHPIVHNIEVVKFDFANSIDTLKNNIKKTVLLTSSPNTKIEGTPEEINLNIIRKKPNPELYTAGKQPMAVLLEGKFNSVYENRIKPFEANPNKEQSSVTKMIVISDGDVIKNELNKGKPLPLGYNQLTATTYGNKEFLMNAVNYLLDDSGLLEIRSKEVKLPFLNSTKVAKEQFKWQLFNLALPLIILGAFAFGFSYWRKRKYERLT